MSVFVPDPGMSLGLGVMVRTVAENGMAANYGVKPGDEIHQVRTHPHTLTLSPIDQKFFSVKKLLLQDLGTKLNFWCV